MLPKGKIVNASRGITPRTRAQLRGSSTGKPTVPRGRLRVNRGILRVDGNRKTLENPTFSYRALPAPDFQFPPPPPSFHLSAGVLILRAGRAGPEVEAPIYAMGPRDNGLIRIRHCRPQSPEHAERGARRCCGLSAKLLQHYSRSNCPPAGTPLFSPVTCCSALRTPRRAKRR